MRPFKGKPTLVISARWPNTTIELESDGTIIRELPLAQLRKAYPDGAYVCILGNWQKVLSRLDEVHHADDRFDWQISIAEREAVIIDDSEDSGHVVTTEIPRLKCWFFHRRKKQAAQRFDVWLSSEWTSMGDCESDDAIPVFFDYLDWLRTNNFHYAPFPGSWGIRRLSEHYERNRRKVPWQTNAKVRSHIPGNHYGGPEHERGYVTPRAAYVDLRSAYHWIAAVVALPDAVDVWAQGDFDGLIGVADGDEDVRWQPISFTEGFLGLVKCKVTVPIEIAPEWDHPVTHLEPGEHIVHLWSNEIDYLVEHGIVVHYLIAAWGTRMADKSIPAYARAALDEIASNPSEARRRWLKAAAIAAYGCLAARPSTPAPVTYRGKGEEHPILGTKLIGRRRDELPREARTTNCLQLGMIQAEVRKRMLQMAHAIEKAGGVIELTYADSIIFSGPGPPVDKLDEDDFVHNEVRWSLKGYDRFLILDPVSFTAATLTDIIKMPGRDRARRDQELAEVWRDTREEAYEQEQYEEVFGWHSQLHKSVGSSVCT